LRNREDSPRNTERKKKENNQKSQKKLGMRHNFPDRKKNKKRGGLRNSLNKKIPASIPGMQIPPRVQLPEGGVLNQVEKASGKGLGTIQGGRGSSKIKGW